MHTSDFVPTTKVPAIHGLTVARQHLAPRSAVPGRRHAAQPAVRTHPAGSARPPAFRRHHRDPVILGAGGTAW